MILWFTDLQCSDRATTVLRMKTAPSSDRFWGDQSQSRRIPASARTESISDPLPLIKHSTVKHLFLRHLSVTVSLTTYGLFFLRHLSTYAIWISEHNRQFCQFNTIFLHFLLSNNATRLSQKANNWHLIFFLWKMLPL